MKSARAFSKDIPYHGFGVGLRHTHFDEFTSGRAKEVSWVEVISENFMPWRGGDFQRPLQTLLKVRDHYPVALHGVSLSVGSTDPLNEEYLHRLKRLIDRVEPFAVSDHLCWTGVAGNNLHDLLPLPYTEEAIAWVAERVVRVQEFLGRRILLENVSSYVEFANPEMSEGEFVAAVAERADCGILLDVNNIYVSSFNHRFVASSYLEHIPKSRVGQIHLAGYTHKDTHIVDTHSDHVSNEVWQLYAQVAESFPAVNTMIEWDDDIPSWPILAAEVQKAQTIFSRVCHRQEGETRVHSQRKSTPLSQPGL